MLSIVSWFRAAGDDVDNWPGLMRGGTQSPHPFTVLYAAGPDERPVPAPHAHHSQHCGRSGWRRGEPGPTSTFCTVLCRVWKCGWTRPTFTHCTVLCRVWKCGWTRPTFTHCTMLFRVWKCGWTRAHTHLLHHV